jgi:hypothetical protein
MHLFSLLRALATAFAAVSSHSSRQETFSLLSSARPIDGIVSSADDLTSQELALRFAEVLAHFRNESRCTLSPEQVQENMLRTRHSGLRLSRCYVAESSVQGAGLGVFAGRNIEKGEMITLYPGDALLKWENANDFEDRAGVNVLFGPHITPTERANVSKGGAGFFSQGADWARLYEVRVSGLHSLVGDPGRISDPAYLGHMLNDFSILAGRSRQAKRAYTISSLKGANAKIKLGDEGCHVLIVATMAIKCGEECFLSYGEMYWLSRLVPSNAKAKQLSNKKRKSRRNR